MKIGPSHYIRTRGRRGIKGKGSEKDIVVWTEELTGQFRKLHYEQLNVMYCTTNVLQVVKVRRLKIGRACGMSAGNLQEGGDFENLGVVGKIILKKYL